MVKQCYAAFAVESPRLGAVTSRTTVTTALVKVAVEQGRVILVCESLMVATKHSMKVSSAEGEPQARAQS